MTTYSYDRENRLISQNVDGNVTSFAYDGFGRKRRESRGVNPDVILNWDGDQMIVESSDLDPEAPSKAYYVADGVIYAENANLGSKKSRRDYAVDFLGSVTGLTDSEGSISSVRRWSAYGKLLSGSSEPIGYFWTGNTGSRVYQSLGLNDNRARHYGRNIKQWITRDPLWPSELPYAYVGGNPVTRIDPSGKIQVPNYGPLFCPTGPFPGVTSCNTTSGGGCPNTANDQPPNLTLFDAPGPADSKSHCDPSTIDRGAIELRLAYVKKKVGELCSVKPQDGPIPPEIEYGTTDPSGKPKFTITARPCTRLKEGGGHSLGCAVYCAPGYLTGYNEWFVNPSAPKNGLGCLVCCTLAHENVHCVQFLLGQRTRTAGLECAGWRREQKCLENVLRGNKCSSPV
jgi:RHS repeat-associated protein